MFARNDAPDRIYNQLSRIYNSAEENRRNIGVLWRLAKCYLRRGLDVNNETLEGKARRRQLLETGKSKIITIDKNDFNIAHLRSSVRGQSFAKEPGGLRITQIQMYADGADFRPQYGDKREGRTWTSAIRKSFSII